MAPFKVSADSCWAETGAAVRIRQRPAQPMCLAAARRNIERILRPLSMLAGFHPQAICSIAAGEYTPISKGQEASSAGAHFFLVSPGLRREHHTPDILPCAVGPLAK